MGEQPTSPADLLAPLRSMKSSHQAFEAHPARRTGGSAEQTTVLIAAGDCLFRQGLRLFLTLQQGIHVIGEAATTSQALSIAETFQPDILLLSIQMLKTSGLDFLTHLHAKSYKTKVLILSSTLEDSFIVGALRQGAMGYLLETATPSDLIKAIQTTCAGEIWAQREVLTQVIEGMRCRISELEGHSVEPGEHLTEREREIVQRVMQGMTNKEIAIRLGISQKTVKSHLHSIFGKLKISRRFQLFRASVDSPSE